jgi:hypothetical protein
MNTRRRLLAGASLMLGAAALPGLSWAQGPTRIAGLGEAVNQAGAQRMLSQRMGKAWLSQTDPRLCVRAQDVLQASQERFERQLDGLLRFAPNPEIAGSYRALSHRYADYKALLAEAPTAEALPSLLVMAGEVLTLAHRGTLQLVDQSPSGQRLPWLINVAGRQRMLSQRLALLALAQRQGNSPALRRESQTAVIEFESAMQVLREARDTAPAIRANLVLADAQWVFLKAALNDTLGEDRAVSGRPQAWALPSPPPEGGQSPRGGPSAACDVFGASENLLTVMDTVTGQYAARHSA